MISILLHVFDWSEVWALLIPISIIFLNPFLDKTLKPVIVYLYVALILNFLCDFIADFKNVLNFPHWLKTNNYLYNIHSIVRMFFFSIFFIKVNPKSFVVFKKLILLLFFIFVIINFVLLQSFFNYKFFSSRLISAETILLLIFCLLYYYKIMVKDDQNGYYNLPSFWIITGLCIYIVTSLPIFIFYKALILENSTFGEYIWYAHNIAYIIFNIFIAIGFNKIKLKNLYKENDFNSIT